MIEVRKYQEKDASALAAIYYNTIHVINTCDYTPEQVNAWAPKSSLETEGWMKKWKKLPPYVALTNDIPVGFTEFDTVKGYIDCFYVHHKHQAKGVGTALMEAVLKKAELEDVKRIWSEVSITAKPFFEAKGFEIVKEKIVNLRRVELTNFVMERRS